jgi:sec-independent protein translocase protein TatA
MGLGGISLWQLLIVLLIVVLIFGTKRLSTIGKDLGGAVKGFRKAMSDAEKEDEQKQLNEPDAEFSEAHSEKDPADRDQTS